MDHEIIFLGVLVSAVITSVPLDALVDFLMLLEIASLTEAHVAKVACEGFCFGVAAHVRGEFGERQ